MSPMPELAYLQHQENKILVRPRAASAVARGVSRVWCVSQSGQAALFRNDRSIMSCMSASVGDQCGPWARARGPTWVPRVVSSACRVSGSSLGMLQTSWGKASTPSDFHDNLYGSIYRARAKARRGESGAGDRCAPAATARSYRRARAWGRPRATRRVLRVVLNSIAAARVVAQHSRSQQRGTRARRYNSCTI